MANRVEDKIDLARKPWTTWILSALCVSTFLSMLSNFSVETASRVAFIEFGAAAPLQIWSGEVWRLATAIFLHGNLLHLMLNIVVLMQVGRLLESLLGPARFLMIFLVCGIAGFSISLLMHAGVSMGASGAVFGLVGALVALLILTPKHERPFRLLRTLTLFIVVNFILGVGFNSYIHTYLVDNYAHLGGLLCGFLFGVGFASDAKIASIKPVLTWLALTVVAIVFFASTLLAVRPTFLWQYQLLMAQQAFLEKRYDDVRSYIERLSENKSSVGYAHVLDGRLAAADNRNEKANHLLLQGLSEINPSYEVAFFDLQMQWMHHVNSEEVLFIDEKGNAKICAEILKTPIKNAQVWNDCAWLLLMAKDKTVHDPVVALAWAQQAVLLGGSQLPLMLHTLSEAYKQNHLGNEAKAALQRALVSDHGQTSQFLLAEKKRLDAWLAQEQH